MPIQLVEVIQLSIELLARAEKAEARVQELEAEKKNLIECFDAHNNGAQVPH